MSTVQDINARIAEMRKRQEEAKAAADKAKEELAQLEKDNADALTKARESAIKEMVSAVKDGLASLIKSDPTSYIRLVKVDALQSLLGAETATDESKALAENLKSAAEALSEIGGVKLGKSGNGKPKTETDTVKLSQKRVLAFLSSEKGKTATMGELAEVAFQRKGATIDGSHVGAVSDPAKHPYSLLGRGWAEVIDETDNTGKERKVIRLTKDGVKAAKENPVPAE